jgi:hypothetical protein
VQAEPSVPGVVLQVISSPGLSTGNFQRLSDKPVVIRSEHQAQLLIDALLDPDRKLPVIVLSVPSTSVDLHKPLLDAPTLAKAAAGLALVVVLPAQASWSLTERFGKQLSVYEGAARVYLPGFTEDANPFSGHQLILPQWLSTPYLFVESLRRYFDVLMARGHLTKQPLGWTNVESFLKVCYGSWGQKGCFSVNSMREFGDLPPKARQIMVASVMKAHQLLIDNLAAARGSRDDNDSLAGLIVTFFSGICLEQNLGPDRARITKKIDAFMRLIRAI